MEELVIDESFRLRASWNGKKRTFEELATVDLARSNLESNDVSLDAVSTARNS
jgi:hypothetical protein